MKKEINPLPWFEVVPNISEGRDPSKISSIVEVFQDIPGVYLLGAEGDKDHNRSVITLVGLGEALVEGLFLMIQKALEILDLRSHQGVHPRLGVVDVVPWIPLQNATMKDAIHYSRLLAKRVGEELEIPVYLYGESAQNHDRIHLADLRRGGLEKYLDNIQNHASLKPDFGPSKVHPKGGVMAIGARDFLIAYNIILDSSDLKLARSISRKIRKLDGIKALGFALPSKNKVQVSMNIVDFRQNSIPQVYSEVARLASEKGVSVEESELIGLMPAEAMVKSFQKEFKMTNLQPQKVLEVNLWETMAQKNPLFLVYPYLSSLASQNPTPGGGSAAGVTAAIGTALLCMALGKGKKKKASPEILALVDEALKACKAWYPDFLNLARRDEEAYQKVCQGFSNQEEKERAFTEAAMVPMQMISQILQITQKVLKAKEGVKKALLPDFFSGLWILKGAFFSASYMVKCNLPYIKDKTNLENTLEEKLKEFQRLWKEVEKQNPFK